MGHLDTCLLPGDLRPGHSVWHALLSSSSRRQADLYNSRLTAFSWDGCHSLNTSSIPVLLPTSPGNRMCLSPHVLPGVLIRLWPQSKSTPGTQAFHLHRWPFSEKPSKTNTLWPFCRLEKWGVERLINLIVNTHKQLCLPKICVTATLSTLLNSVFSLSFVLFHLGSPFVISSLSLMRAWCGSHYSWQLHI